MRKKMPPKYPKISLITPSYNQANYIKKTIDSVLSQKYPNLEYIVMDGGSTDGTIEILKKYGKKIKWISKKDNGQSDAINRGVQYLTGEFIGYLNSDDYLLENSLFKIAKFFTKNKNAFWTTGKCEIVDENNREVRRLITYYKNIYLKYFRSEKLLYVINYISQPATFWRKELFKKIGYFDEKLNYSMDYDFWIRIAKKYKLYFIDEYLAAYRVHNKSKAVISPQTQFKAEYMISSKYIDSKVIQVIHKIHYMLALLVYRFFYL